MTPDRQAATYSPALWPIIAAGVMPHDSSSVDHRVLGREQRRERDRRTLRAARPPRPTSSCGGKSNAAQIEPELWLNTGQAGVDRVAVHRLLLVELAAHAGVLRAAAWHHEHRPTAARASGWLRDARCGSLRVPSAAAASAARTRPRPAVPGTPCARRAGVNATSARSTSGWARRVCGEVGARSIERGGRARRHRDQLRCSVATGRTDAGRPPPRR